MGTILNGNEKTNLWFPVRDLRGRAVKSGGNYLKPVQRMQIMVDADLERRAKRAVVSFPFEGLCYFIEDVQQLHAIIEKLQNIERQITGKGETKVVAFENRPDWSE